MGRRAEGVKVRDRSGRSYDIFAPNLVSSIGLYETRALLPPHVDKMSEIAKISDALNPGTAPLYVMLILNGTKEEIGLTSASGWGFEHCDLGGYFRRWYNQELHQSLKEPFPMIVFVSNSAKDPMWNDHPQHIGKSTMQVMAPVNWKWFEKLSKTSHEYNDVKDSLGAKLLDKMLHLYPKAKGRIEHMEVWTPLTQREFLGKHKGATYGLQDDMAKLDDPRLIARMRAETGIAGLYLTGKVLSKI